MSSEDIVTIDSRQLQKGMYVYIDMGWMDHPFPISRFKIKSEEQLHIIRELGIQQIRYCPSKSDVPPLPLLNEPLEAKTPETASPELQSMQREKQLIKEKQDKQRKSIYECQKTIARAATLMRSIQNDIFANPQACVDSAGQLIEDFVKILMRNSGTVLFALNDQLAGEEIYNHSVNVSVMATLLAKELQFPEEVVKSIGVGCLFHDIGKLEIPSKVTLKRDSLTAAEISFLQEHPNYGEKIARNAKLDPGVIAIVTQHHEFIDGSGYPRKLKEEQISPLAQLVSIINLYDNLCNPINPANALTPHEALSKMYAQFRTKLNNKMLQLFIRFMGVYPPGSIVSLSNGTIGIVVSISSGKTTNPTLLIYDPDVPKEEALLLDLGTLPEVNISKAVRPSMLEPEVYAYLNPRKRSTYFFDSFKK